MTHVSQLWPRFTWHTPDGVLILEHAVVDGVHSGTAADALAESISIPRSRGLSTSKICNLHSFLHIFPDLASDTGHILDGDLILGVDILAVTLLESRKASAIVGGTPTGYV